MLKVENLSCHYTETETEVTAVQGLSFELQKNQILGLIGESGSGKSTVAWALLGMLGQLGGHAHGKLSFEGSLYDFHHPETWPHLRWREIAIVPQAAMNSFNPVYTVGQSLTEVLQVHLPSLDRKEREARAREMLQKVELDPGVFHSYPHQLSGGMRQRAALAKALICRPKVLILDEATTGLDVITEGNILKTVVSLQKEMEMSLILITHDLRLVENLCHQCLILKDGVPQTPDSPYARKLFASMARLGRKAAAGEKGTPAPLLEARGMSKKFRKPGSRESFLALDRVNLSLYAGKITGLVGASGSGKSTLVNILFHLLRSDGGSVTLKGKPAPSRPREIRKMQSRMGLVRQDPFESLPPHEKIFDVVSEPLQIHGLLEGGGKDRERVYRALRDVGLDPETYADRYPHQLSGGQRQRVAIARALVTDPLILALDEPTSMLDATIKQEILQLIALQARKKGIAVLLVTHDLAAASSVCDDILVLHHGKRVAEGPFEVLLKNTTSSYFQQLLLAATDLKGYWQHLDKGAAAAAQPGKARASR